MNNYSVYVGRQVVTGPIVYVGITMQVPERRFSWHRSNGKRLLFGVVATNLTQEEAAAKEFQLIQEHLPTLNKRGMSLPKSHLSTEDLAARQGNKVWCQVCFRRTVGKGYKICLWCERLQRKRV